mmetsp:Transcript_13301/g.31924  ORF Transcript_13301/g.31924 Transcript_13301/m.31924 type:complete len:235 (+) Transcript_13301:1493-2197(+)
MGSRSIPQSGQGIQTRKGSNGCRTSSIGRQGIQTTKWFEQILCRGSIECPLGSGSHVQGGLASGNRHRVIGGRCMCSCCLLLKKGILLLLLHGQHHLFHSSQHVQFQASHTFFCLGTHFGNGGFQSGNLFLEGLDFALLILAGGVASSASRSLNLLQEFTPTALKVLIEKGNVLGSVGIKVAVANGLGLHLAEPIEIQLARKTAEFVVIKELWNDRRSKEIRVLDYKHIPIWCP